MLLSRKAPKLTNYSLMQPYIFLLYNQCLIVINLILQHFIKIEGQDEDFTFLNCTKLNVRKFYNFLNHSIIQLHIPFLLAQNLQALHIVSQSLIKYHSYA